MSSPTLGPGDAETLAFCHPVSVHPFEFHTTADF